MNIGYVCVFYYVRFTIGLLITIGVVITQAIQQANNQILMTSRQVDCVIDQSPSAISSPGRSFQMVAVGRERFPPPRPTRYDRRLQ